MNTPMPSPEMRPVPEILKITGDVAQKRTQRSPLGLLAVGALAGITIAIACIATLTVTHTVENSGMARLLTALLFPMGLCIIIFMGGELYTGNSLMVVGYLDKKVTLSAMLYNWFWVYLGNFFGVLSVIVPYAQSYQLSQNSGALAVSILRTAVTKVNISWYDGIVLGIYCNILVCIAVLICTGARDPMGKVLGALIPVALFVMCGFEHCVANMCYIPLGLLTKNHSGLAQIAQDAGVAVDTLDWGSFFLQNLIPVSLGNTIGGLLVGAFLWYIHLGKGSVLTPKN